MKLIAQYLEKAIDFKRMADIETDSALKANLLKQAVAYRKLADERAVRLKLAPPS